MSTTTRLLSLDDVSFITELVNVNRDFLAPWEPIRGDDYFTIEGKQAVLQTALDQYEQGTTLPHVILVGGEVVGRITLNNIVRGPFQSCNLGYWVVPAYNGRGVATEAARLMTRVAFEELGLHRIQAGTLLHNFGSQRVLERNGFTRFGMAPKYLSIAGEWQDHALFQLLATDDRST